MFEKEIEEIVRHIGDQRPCMIAIDGRCGSGKSTLGSLLACAMDADLFHMDDFFLRPEQRTEERYAVPGENVDHERVEEVLAAWWKQQPFTYRKFDCSTMTLEEETEVVPKSVAVVEGTYSMHKDLQKFYSLSVFLDVDSNLQQKRILQRSNQAVLDVFNAKWIPLEELYFSSLDVQKDCQLHFSAKD